MNNISKCKTLIKKRKNFIIIGIILSLIIGAVTFKELHKTNLRVFIDDNKDQSYEVKSCFSVNSHTVLSKGKYKMNVFIKDDNIRLKMSKLSSKDVGTVKLYDHEQFATQDIAQFIELESTDERVAKIVGDEIDIIHTGHVQIIATYRGETIHGKQIDKEKSRIGDTISINIY